MARNPKPQRSKRGRPEKRILNLDASPEEVFQRIFDNATPPDPDKGGPGTGTPPRKVKPKKG